jgi:hypothetical protein
MRWATQDNGVKDMSAKGKASDVAAAEASSSDIEKVRKNPFHVLTPPSLEHHVHLSVQQRRSLSRRNLLAGALK